ncbi:protein of unknown function [Pseudomonas inefficax]|uniref:Uncharacterized protein n=1 Tax=Pseudomonas inefficax TaxID=2078786 RepID=A0AAQ1PDC3_9PSED|nr:protein of unknown function [Pseudomonas inefficax]
MKEKSEMAVGVAALRKCMKIAAFPVGAGSPANTGEAGAMHRVDFFAGKPAPTGIRSAMTGFVIRAGRALLSDQAASRKPGPPPATAGA